MKMMLRRRGAVSGMVGFVAASMCLWIGASVGSADPSAHIARRLNVTEDVSLSLVRKSGSTLYERGTATGTLPGGVSARFQTSLTKVTGSVTFYPNGGGSLTINVVGYPQSTGTVARFSGSLAVRSGTGRFDDALGSGSFTGTVNRRTWHVSVHATARLRY